MIQKSLACTQRNCTTMFTSFVFEPRLLLFFRLLPSPFQLSCVSSCLACLSIFKGYLGNHG